MSDLAPHEKARAWRIANRYTIKRIMELTGYSRSAISDFETGIANRGNNAHPVSPKAFQRYRMALAAIAAGKEEWDFE